MPGDGDELDSLHCDTPTAYWFPDREEVLIYYMGYPRAPQDLQPGTPFGSGVMNAVWSPGEETAKKTGVLLRPEGQPPWGNGWLGGFLLLGDSDQGWYALLNASPTPPEDDSHREPAPSLGGWAFCEGRDPARNWRLDGSKSPFLQPVELSPEQIRSGMGVNFWRHHMLVTDDGQARIYFNSGAYGHEQMYSMTIVSE